ncbi:MAG: hypothetical protein M1817_005737 [Caeruleum heppii]|nr:MAG: hypothetical protein M1817_005737 [Caeruleum heppii]
MDRPRIIIVAFLTCSGIVSLFVHQPSSSQRHELHGLLQEDQHRLDLLNSTRYHDFDPSQDRWLNLTGLRQPDGYAWDALPHVKAAAFRDLSDLVGARGVSWLGDDEGHDENRTAQFSLEGAKGEESSLYRDSVGVYKNITGLIQGEWVRTEGSEDRLAPQLNLTTLAPNAVFSTAQFDRNITGSSGKVQIKLDEKTGGQLGDDKGQVKEIKARMTIQDDTTVGDGWEMRLYGVHFPEFGQVILTTTSEKFAGLFALPHFALSEHTFNLSRRLLNQTLTEVVKERETTLNINAYDPLSSSLNQNVEMMNPTPHCEYLVYLQQHVPTWATSLDAPVTDQIPDLTQAVEDELRDPQGAPLPPAEPMTMTMRILSPDCGFLLESKGPPRFHPSEHDHLRGLKSESYMRQVKNFALGFGLICALQVLLLMRQMEEASTPSTVSRVSFFTITILALGDGFAAVMFFGLGVVFRAAFMPLFTAAFMAFVGMSFFGVKFLNEIWTVQAPEARRVERMTATTATDVAADGSDRRPAVPSVIITPSGTDTLPPPVTARQAINSGATPVILPPDQDLDAAEVDDDVATNATTIQTGQGILSRELGAIYSRFYFGLLLLVILCVHAASWPSTLRSIYTNLVSLLYLSFWVPQIYRNVMRNCRRALSWEFVVGQSILRLAPFLFFYTVDSDHNVLFVEPDRTMAFVLFLWVWCQAWALVSQDVLGPRFFVPAGFAPPAYDYHPVLREDDLETGGTMPLGFSQATAMADDAGPSSAVPGTAVKDGDGKGRLVFDCGICMDDIDVAIVPAGGDSSATSLAGGILGRRLYMVTPCRHIFHSHCLEGWMRFRLQCPICRETLPPL